MHDIATGNGSVQPNRPTLSQRTPARYRRDGAVIPVPVLLVGPVGPPRPSGMGGPVLYFLPVELPSLGQHTLEVTLPPLLYYASPSLLTPGSTFLSKTGNA